MRAVPKDEGLGGIEGKLRQAKEEARRLAPAEAAELGNAELVTEERKDLVLGIEGSNRTDIAYTLPSNHTGLGMGLSCVPGKPLQRKLLSEVGKNKEREGGKNEKRNPPLDYKAQHKRCD